MILNNDKYSVACGGNITSPTIIQSTNHSNQYLVMQHCEWHITFAEGEKINLDFKAFDLEYDTICQYDWLQIHDGNNSNSPLIGHRMCGNEIPQSITSNRNVLYIKFSSDGSGVKTGFTIAVTRSNLTGIF